ncbi:MAG: LamG domain-containing protein, partial [Kiritimatiellae bacterium]|nr:LamG domain-containing protein [Kiritimatiellia bacterium]
VSRDIQIRPIDSEDFLKQFTVECWILPERTDVAQTVVERAVAYEGDSIGTAAYAIRANFRIGIDAQGVVYGMFDNNDSIESGLNSPNSCQFVKGKEVTAGKWTHVALSFDGKVLSLYIDGYPVKRAPTGLTPANGVVQIRQNPGNTAAFTAYEYRATPCALLIGARPKAKNLYALYPYFINELGMHMESFDNVQEYFKGYVDEVRVWDGARTSQQILANYRKAMGYADAAANRSEVFEVYAQAGTRNNNDGNLTLPPELVLNYGFSTLPGAVNAADVAKVPGGFYAKVLDAAMSDYASNPDIDRTGLYDNLLELKGVAGGWVAGDLLVGWWNDSLIHSTVYDDYHVVPWIRNTVSHLPLMDGSSPDSFVYGDYFGAVYTPASEHGLAKYTFPNSAVPYPTTVRNLDAYYRLAQAARRVEQLGGVYSNALVECQFQVRNNFVGTADLIPLGGAYAKTCPKLWDGDVADPWEQTLSDANGDGIPDWWEEYARYNYAPDVDPAMAVGWDTLVDYHGTSMKAGLAYVIDIYRGLQPDGSIDPAYAVNTDSDGDSIPDWWENIFGIASQG